MRQQNIAIVAHVNVERTGANVNIMNTTVIEKNTDPLESRNCFELVMLCHAVAKSFVWYIGCLRYFKENAQH
jgi:hypothetical protein